MDPVLTTPEGRSGFGFGAVWTRPLDPFCMFWHQNWPGRNSNLRFSHQICGWHRAEGWWLSISLDKPGQFWWRPCCGWMVPQHVPPGARLRMGCLSWAGTDMLLKSSQNNPQILKLKGRRVKLPATSLWLKASSRSVNRVQSVTCHVLYWKG